MTEYISQLDAKISRLRSLLSPIVPASVLSNTHIVQSSSQHYRMRAEFRVWHDGDDLYHIMFDQGTKQKYRVDQLPAANKLINQAMVDVIQGLKTNPLLRQKLFQIDYLSCLNDQVLVSLLYHRPLDDEWETHIRALKKQLNQKYQIDFIGRAKKQKRIVERDYVIETLPVHDNNYTFKHIENSFTQPNALVNCKMIEWAADIGKQLNGDLLELYCGAGNFSIPLSNYFNRVLATEISKTSVNAAQYNIEQNKADNCTILRMSSEEFVEAQRGIRSFRRMEGVELSDYDLQTVLVDPPRSGLDEETCKMISQYDNIIYISCNPDTLADNLVHLTKTHNVVQTALFDQFPFTHHIEAGVFLQRKA